MNKDTIPSRFQELAVHIAAPLQKLYESKNYFKKLHLISDVLLGSLRLYGHSLIRIAESEQLIDEALIQSIETLNSKDSHGLWSSTIAKLIQEFDKKRSDKLSVEIANLFGVTIKSLRQGDLKRMTVRNTVIDSRGQKQKVETVNTPIELLINFRNKYVGHGTVYPETECKEIFEIYEPILTAFLDAVLSCREFKFFDLNNQSLSGFDKNCSGSVQLDFLGDKYIFESNEQLSIEKTDTANTDNLAVKYLFDDDDKKIIESYPYFIAHPYKRALSEEDSFKRLHLLKEILLNSLKYMGLMTASEYFNSNLKIGEINRAFKNFLYRPQFGHWNAFMRNAIQALKEHNHQWFIPELPEFYYEIETQPYEAEKETAIGKLIKFRNHYLGHGTVPTDHQSIKIWNEYFSEMKNLLLRMDFCRNYSVVSSDKTISWRLMGDEIRQVNLRQKLKSNVAVLDAQNNELSLVPFFILPAEYFIKEVADHAKLMIYEQNTGSRIVFFSPESVHGETNNERVLEQLNLMIREKEKQEPLSLKEMNETLWSLLLKENNEATIQSLYAEKKLINGIYQERQDAEISLRSWIGARAGLFFMAAEAGSGKTNLLAEMNRQYRELGFDSILLRGNRFRFSDFWEELCYRMNLTTKSCFEEAEFLTYSQENPLLILIDGANEHSNPRLLLESILTFLERNKGGHIKIVLSWRVNSKSELPKVDDVFEPIIYNANEDYSREDPLIERSSYWLKQLNKVEIEGAWNKYVNYKQGKIRRKPNFSYEELCYHDRSLSDQLDNPLLLRLFLELNNGKGLPKSRGGYISIWSLYHEKIITQ
jgi:hypothetical protein